MYKRQANNDVRSIEDEYTNLKREMLVFKTRYQSFIEAQLAFLDDFFQKIEKEDMNKMDELEAN